MSIYTGTWNKREQRRMRLIVCEIMYREACAAVAQSANLIDITFMPKGLHDIGEEKMRSRLQEEINKTDPEKYEAILLGYGLCNNGVRGLTCPVKTVIFRAHDCIAILIGSRKRYKEYFDKNPGTFFKSPGWIERDSGLGVEGGVMQSLGLDLTYEEFVDKYGEENAEYIIEILGDWTTKYKKLAYINTGMGDVEMFREAAKNDAANHNWEYLEIDGTSSPSPLQRLVDGNWNEDFLIAPANSKITASNDEEILGFEQVSGD